MSAKSPVDDPKRYLEQAGVWLERGRQDYAELQRSLGRRRLPWLRHRIPPDPPVAVYLLQQSIEKTAKSLMIAVGENEYILSKPPYSHNTLATVLKFIERQINRPHLRDAFDNFSKHPNTGIPSSTSALDTIDNLMRSTRRKRDYYELGVLSPYAMQTITGLMIDFRSRINAGVEELLPSSTTLRIDTYGVSDASASEFLYELSTTFVHRDRLSAETEGAFKDIVAPIASELVEQFREADQSVVTVPRDWILSEFVLPSWALSTLYVLAALTFPHEASARYPAPINAPTDPIEAASRGRLGVQHYTEALGIVSRIHELNMLAGLVLDNMDPLLNGAHQSLLMVEDLC